MLVQGMSGDLVPSDWPPLTTDEVRRLLKRLGVEGANAAQVGWQSPRPFSSASLVSIKGGPLFVKRHSAQVRSTASLEAEHAFMRHLGARGISVPVVLGDAQASAWQDGDFVYEVHRAFPGQDLYADAPSWTPFRSLKHAARAGETLARLHLASQGFKAPKRPVEPLYASQCVICSKEPLATTHALAQQLPGLGAYLAARPAQGQQLARALEPLQAQFRPYASGLGSLWAHNDWHPSNLLWSKPSRGDRIAGVIDFGLANLTSAAYDLATALERSTIGWLEPPERRPVHPDLARALLRGYWSVRPLQLAEAVALPHLLALVHVDYALSEVDYFWRVVRSPENAQLAYDRYLLGHLRWFAGANGRRFCSYLAQVIEELATKPPGETGRLTQS